MVFEDLVESPTKIVKKISMEIVDTPNDQFEAIHGNSDGAKRLP